MKLFKEFKVNRLRLCAHSVYAYISRPNSVNLHSVTKQRRIWTRLHCAPPNDWISLLWLQSMLSEGNVNCAYVLTYLVPHINFICSFSTACSVFRIHLAIFFIEAAAAWRIWAWRYSTYQRRLVRTPFLAYKAFWSERMKRT